jgi:hypothetical protein
MSKQDYIHYEAYSSNRVSLYQAQIKNLKDRINYLENYIEELIEYYKQKGFMDYKFYDKS